MAYLSSDLSLKLTKTFHIRKEDEKRGVETIFAKKNIMIPHIWRHFGDIVSMGISWELEGNWRGITYY